ncbi:hypothetical protein N9242_07295 [Vicingaceae bacterium]|nr:hypothetical protein [Vicingaceae bacterium]
MKILVFIISFLFFSSISEASFVVKKETKLTYQELKEEITKPIQFTSFKVEGESVRFEKFKKEFSDISLNRGLGIALGIITVAVGVLMFLAAAGLGLVTFIFWSDWFVSEKLILMGGTVLLGVSGAGLVYLGTKIFNNAAPPKKKKSSKQKQLDSIKKFEGY